MSKLADSDSRRLKWAGATALFVGALSGLATAYVALGNWESPLKMPFAGNLEMSVIAPEGWKFFTKDPHDERLLLFAQDGGGWRSASRGSNGEPANLFGMSRDGRSQGIEAGLLLQHVPEANWKACDGEIASCLTSDDAVARVHNVSPRPTLCGVIGVAMQKPVPFEWARLRTVTMPARVARLEVQC